jgi:hypothetical protein
MAHVVARQPWHPLCPNRRKTQPAGKKVSTFQGVSAREVLETTKNGNDDPIVNAGPAEKNSTRPYFFEFQDCIYRGFLTQDSRLQVTKLSQTLVSLHL